MNSFLIKQSSFKKKQPAEEISQSQRVDGTTGFRIGTIKNSDNGLSFKSNPTTRSSREQVVIQGMIECFKALKQLEEMTPKNLADSIQRVNLAMLPAKGTA